MIYRFVYEIEGTVQGVGFRPAIYCLAKELELGGWIKNCSSKVQLALEGDKVKVAELINLLRTKLPKQAKINKIILVEKILINQQSLFRILDSSESDIFKISIPADLAMCHECENEILDSKNRRYKYPFTTCVNCGPRYTVVNSMPYDRCRTTLAPFKLCQECEREYTDPSDRRFHAESIACPICGPKLFLTDHNGETLKCSNPLEKAAEAIMQGKIVAIRGIGGFLLAVDALNPVALEVLRTKKKRPHKPFALMAKSLDVIKKYCVVNAEAEKLLSSSVSPIVILEYKKDKKYPLSLELISPDTETLGFMLPYSPLHRILFEEIASDILVMTSGNRGGEPICIKNEEAFVRLKGIADFFLCHDREINLRNDDSIWTFQQEHPQMWRRARGHAPDPIIVKGKTEKTILAMGPELKNTIALYFDSEIVISPHIGDLETPEALDSFENVAESLPKFYRKNPEIIAVDLHPDMHSTRLGEKISRQLNIPLIRVQHHHAHAVSCMAEHDFDEGLAVVFDGTGLGTDGNIWGAEVLHVVGDKFTRVATFMPSRLLGGDEAVRCPSRQLVARCFDAKIEITDELLKKYQITEKDFKIWKLQYEKQINTSLSHAAGRLFDSVSALLQVCPKHITYEGQGAICLEGIAKKISSQFNPSEIFPYKTIEKDNIFFIDWNEMFDYLVKKIHHEFHIEPSLLAMRFHVTIADAALKMIEFALSKVSTRNLVLSGGVFMNKILSNLLISKLRNKGLQPKIHQIVPPNDGGVSFGQAIIAGWNSSVIS